MGCELAVDGEVSVALDADGGGFGRGRTAGWGGGCSWGSCGGGDFIGDDLQEGGNTGFGEGEKLGAHAGEVDEGAFVANFDDQVEGLFVDEGAGVGDPSWRGLGSGGVIGGEVDAGAPHVF